MKRSLEWGFFMKKTVFCLAAGVLALVLGGNAMGEEFHKTKEELKKALTPEQYEICFLKGTERPFTGKYVHSKEAGTYKCVVCGNELFKSDTKFDSGTGWPSFWDAAGSGVKKVMDYTHGMKRVEVVCSRCGAHLGHVFEDGPEPTGLRYCINSAALKFEKK
jgi:peptide-methionine (R)-S-oxide reductase